MRKSLLNVTPVSNTNFDEKKDSCCAESLVEIRESFEKNLKEQADINEKFKERLKVLKESLARQIVINQERANDYDDFVNEVNQVIEKLQQKEIDKEQIVQIFEEKFVDNLKELIKKELTKIKDTNDLSTNNSKSSYKLTSNIKFEEFYEYIISELRELDLLYVIDSSIDPDERLDENTLCKNKFAVRHILINSIDKSYHSKVNDIDDPLKILKKLEEIKKSENNLNHQVIKKRLFNMRYNPQNESASYFLNRFDNVVKSYNDFMPLDESEKRKALYDAVVSHTPSLKTVDLFKKYVSETHTELTCDEIRKFIIENETLKTPGAKNMAYSTRNSNLRCYKCGQRNHNFSQCKNYQQSFLRSNNRFYPYYKPNWGSGYNQWNDAQIYRNYIGKMK